MQTTSRFPVGLMIAGAAASLLTGVLVMVTLYDTPQADVQLLILFMVGTAGFSLTSGYLLYRLNAFRHVQSLALTLAIGIIFAVLVVLINVWVIARLMFINAHDFALVSALLVFGGLTAITFGGFIAGALSKALRELAEANERLANGDLTTRLPVKGSDEIAQLTRTFNMMATRLHDIDEQKRMLEQTRRDFVAWVSHDLRTPLTSMRVLIDAIQDGVVTDPETIAGYLATAQKEIQHLSSLIDDLFELAQLDANEPNISARPTALHELVDEAVAAHAAIANQRGIAIRRDYGDALPLVMVDGAKVRRVLHNLLDNALRYTPDSGEIRIRLGGVRDAVQVNVFNSGSRIAPDDLPHVFDRFYRAERSRAHGKGDRRHVGLGLTVAHGLVEAHGGRIWAESGSAGTSFTFTLPAASPPQVQPAS